MLKIQREFWWFCFFYYQIEMVIQVQYIMKIICLWLGLSITIITSPLHLYSFGGLYPLSVRARKHYPLPLPPPDNKVILDMLPLTCCRGAPEFCHWRWPRHPRFCRGRASPQPWTPFASARRSRRQANKYIKQLKPFSYPFKQTFTSSESTESASLKSHSTDCLNLIKISLKIFTESIETVETSHHFQDRMRLSDFWEP